MSYAGGDKCPLNESGNHIFVKRSNIVWVCDCGTMKTFQSDWDED